MPFNKAAGLIYNLVMDRTTITKMVGQLFIIGFEGKTPSKEVESFIQKNNIGGICYFGHNVENPEQLANLTNYLQGLSPQVPLFITIDQEGGLVSRLGPPFCEAPAPGHLEKSSPTEVFEIMQVMGAEMKAVGINWDFAPVCDVDTNPENPIIGKFNRSYSSNVEVVEKLASGAVRGLQKSGVIACAKHFPGHGDTSTDSHLTLPVIEHTYERLNELELKPFRRVIRSGVETVMTAHVLYTAIDDAYPATLSKTIIQELLRKECRFDGVVVSDDMHMKGITEHYPNEQAVVLAVQAGIDQLLYCMNYEAQERALEALVKAVMEKEVPLYKIEESIKRAHSLKKKYIGERYQPLEPAKAKEIVGCAAHHEIISKPPASKRATG